MYMYILYIMRYLRMGKGLSASMIRDDSLVTDFGYKLPTCGIGLPFLPYFPLLAHLVDFDFEVPKALTKSAAASAGKSSNPLPATLLAFVVVVTDARSPFRTSHYLDSGIECPPLTTCLHLPRLLVLTGVHPEAVKIYTV
jgi:hypothetical protein